jgi:hypothetical protein
MKFPSADRYNEAVQNPAVYFLDADVQRRRVQTDALGLPEVLSGGFAFTYRFTGAGGDIAVRCFHRGIPDLLERYVAISAFLARLRSRFFVEFAFVGNGLRVDGRKLPIVRMQWIEGETLLGYVARRQADPRALGQLREQLAAFAEEAERSGYAHGDIQHRNFMVTPEGALKLVDYDGMYVPALRHLRAADAGHPHFRPPASAGGGFGPRMDRFPLAVIDLSLEALQEAPGLFERFHRGENLILSQEDFRDPANSAVLHAIARIPRLAPRVAAFSDLCGLPAAEMPSLREFRAMAGAAGGGARRPSAAPGAQQYASPFDVVDGMDYAAAVAFAGRPVELVGQVIQVKTVAEKGCVFLRFGTRYAATPAVVVPLEAFSRWTAKPALGLRPWISAIGVLQAHRSGRHSSLQLAVKEMSDIDVLSGRDEADFRLGRLARPEEVARPQAAAAAPVPAPEPVGPVSWGRRWIRTGGPREAVPAWMAGGPLSPAAPARRGAPPASPGFSQGQLPLRPPRPRPSPPPAASPARTAAPSKGRIRRWFRRLFDL